MGLLIGVGDFGIGDLITRSEALYNLLLDLCGDQLDWANVLNKPNTLSGYGITDSVTQTRLAELLDEKMDANFQYSYNDLLDLPTNIAESGILDVFTKDEVIELIGEMAVGEHTHPISDIVGLQDALDSLKFKLVASMPSTPQKSSIYCVYSGNRFTFFITDENTPVGVLALDAVTATQLATALATKQDKLTGTAAQIVRGDGSYTALNKSTVGLGNVSNFLPSEMPISDAQAIALSQKANNSDVLHKDGNETKTSGVLTFVLSPSVPTPTNSPDAANKGYVDSVIGSVDIWESEW